MSSLSENAGGNGSINLTEIQGSSDRDTETQRYVDTEIQSHRDTEIRRFNSVSPSLCQTEAERQIIRDTAAALTPETWKLVRDTIPTAIENSWKKKVFSLARVLKSVDILRDEIKPLGSRGIVEVWWKESLPFLEAKDFAVTWGDFCRAWDSVKFEIGDGPMAKIMEEIAELPLPAEADVFETPGIKKLVALCEELQRRAGADAFFLDCRTAGKCAGVDHDTANRWLRAIALSGIIEKTEQGKPGKATRWRWKGSL
jgi:hypothetical protein